MRELFDVFFVVRKGRDLEGTIDDAKTVDVPQQRFFGLLSNLTTALVTGLTSTFFSSTVTSTATVGVVSTCIPSTLFVSTVACRRRREVPIHDLTLDGQL